MTQANHSTRFDGLDDYTVSWKQVSQAQVTVEFVTELATIVIDVLPGMSISGQLHGDVIFSVDGEEHHRVPVVALNGTGAAKRIAEDYALHLGVRIGAEESSMKKTLRLMLTPILGVVSKHWVEVEEATWLGAKDTEADKGASFFFPHGKVDRTGITALLANKGHGKSTLALLLGMSVSAKDDVDFMSPFGVAHVRVPVLIVEGVERSEKETKARFKFFADQGGANPEDLDIHFIRLAGRKYREVEPQIRKTIQKHNIGLIIVDDATVARGGDNMNDVEIGLYHAVADRLGLPSIDIEHVTKEDEARGVGTRQVRGKAIIGHRIRQVIDIKRTQHTSTHSTVVVAPGQTNRVTFSQFHYEMTWVDGERFEFTVISGETLVDDLKLPAKTTPTERRRIKVLALTAQRPMTVSDIASAVDATKEVVRKDLTRAREGWRDQGFVESIDEPDGGDARWAATASGRAHLDAFKPMAPSLPI